MLVLSRKEEQGVSIRNASTGESLQVFILRSKNGRVSIGVDAPQEFEITRIEMTKTPERDPGAAESR